MRNTQSLRPPLGRQWTEPERPLECPSTMPQSGRREWILQKANVLYLLLLFFSCPAFVVGGYLWREYVGYTALHRAAGEGDTAVIRRLVQGGMNVNMPAPNPIGNSPLHEAVSGGKPKAVECLLELGADKDIRNNYGRTPLHEAGKPSAAKGYARGTGEPRAQAAEVLLAHGADPNSVDKSGDTPLQSAILDQNAHLVRLLIEHGASVKAVDSQGYTCVDTARMMFGGVNSDPHVLDLVNAAARSSNTQKARTAETIPH